MREISFQATWTQENSHLQYNISDILASPFHSFCQKIYLCFSRTMQYLNEWIGYPIHQYAKQYLIGGSARLGKNMCQQQKLGYSDGRDRPLLFKTNVFA
ncbi:MAG: hypothetical protein JSR93_08885 [Verrucomicrobia bacterium]|nr:hypothetical protein [Verrucomicrobiota bacterium]